MPYLVGEVVERRPRCSCPIQLRTMFMCASRSAGNRAPAARGRRASRIVHAPAAAARGDVHAVDADREVRLRQRRRRSRVTPGDALPPAVSDSAQPCGLCLIPTCVTSISCWPRAGLGWLHVHAPQPAGAVEQRQVVADLADAEAQRLACRRRAPTAQSLIERSCKCGFAVAVGPPKPRVEHMQLRNRLGAKCTSFAPGGAVTRLAPRRHRRRPPER